MLLEEGSRSPLLSFEKVDDNQHPADQGYDFNRELVEVLQYLDELFFFIDASEPLSPEAFFIYTFFSFRRMY